MKESAKCRSGRDGERVTVTRPSGRGGKMPHTLGNEERVAAQDDRDVMVPPGVRAAFEVIEAELALELFVGSFRAPSFLHGAHDLLLRHPPRQGREDAVRRLRFRMATAARKGHAAAQKPLIPTVSS